MAEKEPISEGEHFINDEKLCYALEQLQHLLFNELNLTPLERDVVLKIALRQENKMQLNKDQTKLQDMTTDLMRRAGFT